MTYYDKASLSATYNPHPEEYVVMYGNDILESFTDIEQAYSYIMTRRLNGANIIKPDKDRKIRANDAARMQYQINGRPPRMI
jgi:hypothetical protein